MNDLSHCPPCGDHHRLKPGIQERSAVCLPLKKLEQLFGAKERSFGAMWQHINEDGC